MKSSVDASVSKARDDKLARDSHVRSVLKSISWRFVATLTTVVIAWIVTGDTVIALEIGAIEIVAKLLIFYAHERAWQLGK